MVLPYWITLCCSSLSFTILSPTFFTPLTNLPHIHYLSLSCFMFQYYCLQQLLRLPSHAKYLHSTDSECFPLFATNSCNHICHASTTEILCCMLCFKTTFIVSSVDLKLIFHHFCGIFQCSVRGRRPWDPCPAALWKLCWDGGQFCRYTWQHGRTGGHPLQHLVAWSHAGPGGALEIHKCAGPDQHHTVPSNAGLWHRSEGRGWCFLSV